MRENGRNLFGFFFSLSSQPCFTRGRYSYHVLHTVPPFKLSRQEITEKAVFRKQIMGKGDVQYVFLVAPFFNQTPFSFIGFQKIKFAEHRSHLKVI